mgnify:CR=1 FL=1
MPIEIRELLIKVKIEEGMTSSTDSADLEQMKRDVLKECKKEITKQLSKHKER